jgi:methionyl-tRNA formyltransferase
MRVVFAGTPEFARVAVTCLQAAGFEIPLVLTQPDRPAGRGMKLQASSVKQWALAQNIPISQPRSLRLDGKYPEDAVAAKLALDAAQADVVVVAAYGLILPQWVLDHPRLGCFNIHASLLPRWRGAAPIHRAIEAGDSQTGVTIMQMDAGLDTGDMLLFEALPLTAHDSTDSLHDKLAALGGRLIVKALELAACGGLKPSRQPAEGITYAHKIEKHEADIDWSQSALAIARRVRAFNPFPVAFSTLGVESVKLREATVLQGCAPPVARPGEVVGVGDAGVDIATGDGILRVSKLQKAGGKTLAAADFLRGFDIRPGMVFGRSA